MCIIVDANRLGGFLGEPPHEEAVPIHKWLERRSGSGMIVYSTGGKFASELGAKARKKLSAYVQAGKARLEPADRFADDEDVLRSSGLLRSDDPHVLALARASGARLLYTGDEKLVADFKNAAFISQPRGKVYSNATNAGLLTSSTCRR